LYDKGLAPTKEPFKKLVHQGMILGSNGIKMGKRFPEFVVNPSDVVRDYGADTLRLYEMFMGPLEVSKPWSNQGVDGARKFLNRVWTAFTESDFITDGEVPALEKIYHKSVKKITEDFEKLAFNTAISQMMIFINAVYKEGKCPKAYAEGMIKMLSCIAPHICEEMWSIFGHEETIAYESWPTYDESKCADDEVEIVVQVNGKLRAKIKAPVNTPAAEAIALAKAEIESALEGKTIVKEICVPNKIVNIVVR
ncbi:MAG: class I tRNA ligase family protein, partial [Clostridia bacterium]|nr:class I tRNA ligase family protein [Clostridia bacterium]